ncbi:hypothetical protein TWF730_003872 [Orbilia blumenaviensis]|uniref:RDRP core domain-containing protein n=1 Tax=Orbilia blumenaviensis TaxID=1796055 RepID=A0AAV9U4T2_9PEZI
MSTSSNFTLRDDLTYTQVFHALKTRFGLPLPPEQISLAALGQDKFDFFAQSKFLLTYARRNFAAAVREFEVFANLDNLAEDTLTKASGVRSSERRKAAIQKRRIRAFNQELQKQLKIFNRDGGSIVTQGNHQRQSVISIDPAGKRTTTDRSSSLMKASDKTRRRVLEWQETNMAAGSGHSSNPPPRSLRSRESWDNEMNSGFPGYYEEATEIDIEPDDSGLIPVDSFRAETLAGTLPEFPLGDHNNMETHHHQSGTVPYSSSLHHISPPSSQPPNFTIHSPPAKPVKSQNHNWGTYVPPEDSLIQPRIFAQVPKPPNKPIFESKPPATSAPEQISNSLALPTNSDLNLRLLPREDSKKRKQNNYPAGDSVEPPWKRPSSGPQDRIEPTRASAPKQVSGPSNSRAPVKQPSWTENQAPVPLVKPRGRQSFETDTTETSAMDSLLQSRNEYQSTQPTSFNSTMEGKLASPGRYDDTPLDFVPPARSHRDERRVGPVHTGRSVSGGTTNSGNTSRPVMRSGNGARPASPSSQLQSEQDEASSRKSYSVGCSTVEEMCLLGPQESTTGKKHPPAKKPQQRPQPAPRPITHTPATGEASSSAQPQSRGPLARSFSSKHPRHSFYKTLEGENFPGDHYEQLFSNLNTPFWLQWESQRLVVETSGRTAEASFVQPLLKELVSTFVENPSLEYAKAQEYFATFGLRLMKDEKSGLVQVITKHVYGAIFESERNWDHRIQLSAELKFERVSDPAGTGIKIWRPTLWPRPLSLRTDSCRFDLKFGSDRFLILRIPQVGSETIPSNQDITYADIARYLSHEGFEYLGRRWRAIHHRPANKDENGNKFKKVDKSLQASVIMFAESGPGLALVDHRAAVEWMIPLSKDNLKLTQCKFYSRIALGLTTTSPTIVFEREQIKYISDVHSFFIDNQGKEQKPSLTDGCGLISPAVSRQVARILGLPYPPSAVQARIVGAKGLWIIDPDTPLESDEVWIKIRSDQNKYEFIEYEEEHRTLHVCGVSKALNPSALNLQFIAVLLHNGVTETTLGELLCEDIDSEVTGLFTDGRVSDGAPLRAYIERVRIDGYRKGSGDTPMHGRMPALVAERAVDMINAGFTIQHKALEEHVKLIMEGHYNSILNKMNIRVPQSCRPYCVPDPTKKLEKGQVYLRFGPGSTFINHKTDLPIDVLKGGVLLARNPAHFGSDIQLAEAVDIPELRHLTNVVVFAVDPDSGDRSPADYLSGGDYDGDEVWTCWDQRLVNEFRGERVHGPSTINIDHYFVTDCRTMHEDFTPGEESPTAFSDFIQRQLETAMKDSILGQCTSFWEKFVYKNHNDPSGVLNLREAKELGVVCGKLVDAPKQGTWPRDGFWNTLKGMHGKLPLPYYKWKDLSQKDKEQARNNGHPVDKLKFTVADQKLNELRALFGKSAAQASHRDDHLLAYGFQCSSYYEALRKTGEKFLIDEADAYHRQKVHLNDRIARLRSEWGGRWAETMHSRDREIPEDSDSCYAAAAQNFDRILPAPDETSEAAKALVRRWNLDINNPYGNWNRLKASVLYEKVTSFQDSKTTLAWAVAHDIYCYEKLLAANENRRSGFVIQPILRATRVKSSALKGTAESKTWFNNGTAEEDDADSSEPDG